MMKSAQEMQTIKTNYEAKVAELIEAAKKLEDPDEIMARAARVAELAKAVEQLRTEMDAKQQELMKKMGGGIGIFGGAGGFGESAFGVGGIDIDVLPVFPKEGLPLPNFDPK
jgi:tetrahydromethanopterin S-methyltransferase subunit G